MLMILLTTLSVIRILICGNQLELASELESDLRDNMDCGRKSVRLKCPYSELFWSAFSRIRTECGVIWSISPNSIRTLVNADQNNSEYEHFSRSHWLVDFSSRKS